MKCLTTLAVACGILTGFSNRTTAVEFIEPDYGFSFDVDEATWKPAPIPVSTLGESIAVLVDGQPPTMLFNVFVRTSRDEQQAAEAKLASIREKLGRLTAIVPDAEQLANEVVDKAGRKAVSFRMSGPGSGLGLGGGGDTPTVQQWYAFPRARISSYSR